MRAIAVSFALAPLTPAFAAGLPTHIGQCVRTIVKNVGTRLVGGSNDEPVAGSGSAISFANGGYQVSYDQLPSVDSSRPGDPVAMCLVAIPRDCPPGDVRGREYRTTNLRTRKSWRLPDSEHSCGGA
jgi:hypothetical protein